MQRQMLVNNRQSECGFVCVGTLDPRSAGPEGQGVAGADGCGQGAGPGPGGDAPPGERGGEERQRHPTTPETAEGGRTHPGWYTFYYN